MASQDEDWKGYVDVGEENVAKFVNALYLPASAWRGGRVYREFVA